MPHLKSRLFVGADNLRAAVRALALDESGATAIEYSLIAALIGVAIIAAVQTLGTTISAKFAGIASNLS